MLWDLWYAFKNIGLAFTLFFKALWKPFRDNFSFQNVLCVQGLLKIAFLYLACLIWIIVFNFDLPDKFDRKATTISIYTTGRIGEKLLAERMKEAAKANGWQVIYICFDESMLDYFFTKHFYKVSAGILNAVYNTKFNIAVTQHVNVLPYGYNITYLNMPNESLYDPEGRFKQRYKHLEDYDAYVDIYSVANGSNPILLKELKRLGKKEVPVMSLYLAQNYIEYSPAKRERAIIIGSLWGCARGSGEMRWALRDLAADNMIVAYGLFEQLSFLGDSYKGAIESFMSEKSMSNAERLNGLMKEYGISLAIHNLGHMVDAIPTSRIAESVAAGAIVISDQNEFAKKFFGDNILYINTIAQHDEIHQQIKRHIEWIRAHPEEAEKKAKAAYDIFAREFTLEKALQTILTASEEDKKRLKK